MKKILALLLSIFVSLVMIPTNAAVANNLLEITAVNPSIVKPFNSLQITALVKSRQIKTVELWLSRNPIADLTTISQDVTPLGQAAVTNGQVTIRRSSMPNVAAGVYQLVLRSISGSSVIGEQAVPIVIGNLPIRQLAVVMPLSVPPTSDEVAPLQTLLIAGEIKPVDWFIDGNTYPKLNRPELNLTGQIHAIASANPDPNVSSKFKLSNLLAMSVALAKASLPTSDDISVATWSIKHPIDGDGMRTAISAGLDYVITQRNELAVKYQYQGKEVTELTVDPDLTQLLAATTSPVMVRQYVLAASALTDASAIAPPIGWAPTLELANAFLTTATNIPWVNQVSVTQLANSLEAKATSNISGKSPVFSTKHLRNLDQINRLWSSLSVTTAGTTNPVLTNEAVAATSGWWWLARSSGNDAARQLKTQLADELNLLKISSRNKVILPAATGVIPITITNNRSTPAKIEVSGTALGTAVVRIESTIVEIPAQSKQVIELPIEVVTPGSIYAQLVIGGQGGEDTALPPAVLQIEVSQYRAVAQLIMFGAFGVLVLLSAISVRGRLKKRREIQHN